MASNNELMPYKDLTGTLIEAFDDSAEIVESVNRELAGKTPAEIAEYVEEVEVFYEVPYQSTVTKYATVPINKVKTVPKSLPPAVDSNAITTYNTECKPIVEYDTTTNTFANKTANGMKFFTGSVLPAIQAASIGISLGKTIDSVLYNTNPDFWDANGMAALNPETWSSITNNDAGLSGKIFDMVFGIDQSGNVQPYVEETAYSYLAQWLATQNAFSETYTAYTDVPDSSQFDSVSDLVPFDICSSYTFPGDRTLIYHSVNCDLVLYGQPDGKNLIVLLCFFSDTYGGYVYRDVYDNGTYVRTDIIDSISSDDSFTYDGKTAYGHAYMAGAHGLANPPRYSPTNRVLKIYNIDCAKVGWIALYTDGTEIGGVSGIGSQPNATLPTDTNSWTTPENTLQSLQNQYPDLWQNAIPITTLQPDGTTTTQQYLPVPMPSATSTTSTQPVSADATQTQTQTTPTSSTGTTSLIGNTIATPTTNPNDTGSGSSPTPINVASTASSLWAIYHPTQAQVDSFGAWLWSSNMIDQIKALMFSPIDSIISLHKVYCTPIDMGASTIQVGYLDSEVPSNYVTQQYVYTSCGSVNVSEYFGNVFDYSPHTSINLYLPFIGIVPIDVDSAMRGIMHIVYGVDLITGDCLASVDIQRDNHTSVQYQYSGNCAVHYPLTAGNYASMVASSISGAFSGLAGGFSHGAGVALAGAGIGAVAGAMRSHTDVRRSGGFSGNAGAMGGKKPYLIIERPQTKIANNYPHYQGYPTNAYVTVGECSGFIRASELHTDGVPATDTELDMLRSAFSVGVIV